MNHPTDDQLLLLGYGELPSPDMSEIESHVAACSTCGDKLAHFERARVALDVALPKLRRPVARWAVWGALAAAAVVGGVLIMRAAPPGDAAARGWNPTTMWSATAGYVAGGTAMVDIDARLTRLEQERSYALPN